jgi:hypothetical protein
LPESPALKDQPIVAAQDGSPNRARENQRGRDELARV